MSVTRNEITERLNKVFKEVFSEDVEIFDSMKAGDVEDWDSVTHVILVVAVEKEFGLRLNAAEVALLENVGQMIDVLAEKLGK